MVKSNFGDALRTNALWLCLGKRLRDCFCVLANATRACRRWRPQAFVRSWHCHARRAPVTECSCCLDFSAGFGFASSKEASGLRISFSGLSGSGISLALLLLRFIFFYGSLLLLDGVRRCRHSRHRQIDFPRSRGRRGSAKMKLTTSNS